MITLPHVSHAFRNRLLFFDLFNLFSVLCNYGLELLIRVRNKFAKLFSNRAKCRDFFYLNGFRGSSESSVGRGITGAESTFDPRFVENLVKSGAAGRRKGSVAAPLS